MLRDESMGMMDDATGWTATATTEQYGEWQDIDRELRSIARRQAGLDAELMRALREAERVKLWRHLGALPRDVPTRGSVAGRRRRCAALRRMVSTTT